MKHPYNTRYQPAFPAVPVTLYNNEAGVRTGPENGLLDTGSDGTLVPIAYLQQISAPALVDTRIRSH